MKKIDSQTVVLEKNIEKIFDVLSDVRNFEALLPEKVENWHVEGDVCNFTIAGIGTISVKANVLREFHTITYTSLQSPINVELGFYLSPLNENRTQIDITVSSDANAMVLMMLKHPIRNFLNMISEKAQEVSDTLIA